MEEVKDVVTEIALNSRRKGGINLLPVSAPRLLKEVSRVA